MDTILNYKEPDLDFGIDEGINDPGIFKAVVLAGGPGSGKSYVAQKLGLKTLGLVVVNSDLFFVQKRILRSFVRFFVKVIISR